MGPALEMDRLAPSIRLGPAAFDPAVVLESIEQARQGCAFNSHALGDFLLGAIVSSLGKMNKRPPFPLAQAEGAEPLIEPGAPGAGGPEEDQAELVDVWRRHVQLISVLTNRMFRGLSIAANLRQEHRVIAVIGDPLDHVGAFGQPALAFGQFPFALRLGEKVMRI